MDIMGAGGSVAYKNFHDAPELPFGFQSIVLLFLIKKMRWNSRYIWYLLLAQQHLDF